MSQLETDIGNFAIYADQFKRHSPETVIGALVLKLTDGSTSVITDSGTLQPPLAKTATESFSEVIAANANSIKWNITNLSSTDELYFCLGAEATLLNSRVLLPYQSVWSDNLAEARARVTVVTRSTISVNYSVQLITS